MSGAKFIQIHTLHSYPGTLLNRDDAGLAKRLPFGGVERLRISSQCLKRHWRMAEDARALVTIDPSIGVSTRSRRTWKVLIQEPLLAEGLSADAVNAVLAAMQVEFYGESKKAKAAKAGKETTINLERDELVVLGRPEIDYLINETRRIVGIAGSDEKAIAAELKTLRKNFHALKAGAGIDAAMFGRFVSGDRDARVDAAVHVAHAFTVHEQASEPDYFTAVDDLQAEEQGSGAGHLNTADLTSGVYYGYVVVDVPLLVANLEGCQRQNNPGSGIARNVQQTRVADLEAELAALTKIGAAEADAAANEKARAEAGRLSAERERRTELLSTQRRELEKALEGLATDPAERIALVNRELAETKRRLDALRAPEGGNSGDVDAAVIQAEEIARRKIAAIQGASARRDGSDAAERTLEANRKVIDDLARRLTTAGDERQQFTDQALGRLSGQATSEQRAEVERLANALYDEKLAREQLADAMQAEDRLRQEGARLMEATRTPAEELAATIARLDALMRAGAIDADTHGRALAEAYASAEAAADRALDASRDWQDGVTRALRSYAEEATDAASAAEQVTTKAFQTMEDALVQFVETGKLDFQSLVDSITADLTRLAVRQSITGPLAALLAGGGAGAAGGPAAGSTEAGALGGLGTLLAGLFHEGGVVGANSEPRRAVDPALFLTAPRYHTGGVAGLIPGEIPAILKRGETVLTPRQTSAVRDGLRQPQDTGRPVTVIMNITTPDAGGFRKSQGQIAAEAARAIERARRNL